MNRRTAVGVLGGLVFGTVAAVRGRRALAQAVCTLTPEQIEGPFYLDQARIRDAISEGKPGVPLQLMLRVLEASASCAPIPQAAVDVWQCDALRIYSGYDGARRGRLRRRRHRRAPDLVAQVVRFLTETHPAEVWTCTGFVDTWVKSPMLPVRAAARRLGG